jgi:hypothetical protein
MRRIAPIAVLLVTSLTGVAGAAETHIEVEGDIVVRAGPGRPIAVPYPEPVDVMIVRVDAPDCHVRTVRVLINGHYVKRRITHCDL